MSDKILTPEEIEDFKSELENRVRTGRGYFASLGEMKHILSLLQQEQAQRSIEEHGWIEQVFNAGFDEGYTNPMELNGKLITEEEYERGRKENFEAWLPEFIPEPPKTESK